jgi:hypothetical protein
MVSFGMIGNPQACRCALRDQRLLNARKVNFEGRAFAYLTVNVNMSAGLLDDALAGCQSDVPLTRLVLSSPAQVLPETNDHFR